MILSADCTYEIPDEDRWTLKTYIGHRSTADVDGHLLWLRGMVGMHMTTPNLKYSIRLPNGRLGQVQTTVPRLSWMLWRGDGRIERGMRVYRVCGNARCIRPEHLILTEKPQGGLYRVS